MSTNCAGLLDAALRVGQVPRGRRHRVVILHHGLDQSALGDFDAGARDGFGGDGDLIVGALAGAIDIGVNGGLVDVLARAALAAMNTPVSVPLGCV